jgi:hypothetical protein
MLSIHCYNKEVHLLLIPFSFCYLLAWWNGHSWYWIRWWNEEGCK